MHRFFVRNESLQAEQVVLPGQQAHQICHVLRAKPGDRIIVLDNTGYEYIVTLTDVTAQQVVGQVTDRQRSQAEPRTQITLYQSLLAREKFEWVLQKCTEVGATRFVPMVTERSIVRRADTVTPRRLSRWQRILTEAAEQSGRGIIPQIEAAAPFAHVVSGLANFDRRLIGWPQESGLSLRELLRASDTKPVTIALLIGPEGGFANEELEAAHAAGAISFNLGPRILRTETAAVVASALILHELEG